MSERFLQDIYSVQQRTGTFAEDGFDTGQFDPGTIFDVDPRAPPTPGRCPPVCVGGTIHGLPGKGACCWDQFHEGYRRGCLVTTHDDCVGSAHLGVFHGVGTCCDDGTGTLPGGCTNPSGFWMCGENVVKCTMGSCCGNAGGCFQFDSPYSCCSSYNPDTDRCDDPTENQWQGWGSWCGDHPCGNDYWSNVGACCSPTNQCWQATRVDCLDAGWYFYEGSCCHNPTIGRTCNHTLYGGCCIDACCEFDPLEVTTGCTVTTAAGCTTTGYVFYGTGTSCPATGSCCRQAVGPPASATLTCLMELGTCCVSDAGDNAFYVGDGSSCGVFEGVTEIAGWLCCMPNPALAGDYLCSNVPGQCCDHFLGQKYYAPGSSGGGAPCTQNFCCSHSGGYSRTTACNCIACIDGGVGGGLCGTVVDNSFCP